MQKTINLFNYVNTKDAYRPFIGGVLHTTDSQTGRGVAVATDMSIMIISEQHYNSELAGKIELKKGGSYTLGEMVEIPGWPDKKKTEKANAIYPKWESVLPQHFERDWMEVPTADFFGAALCASNFLKNAPATYEDGSKIKGGSRTVRCRVTIVGADSELHHIFFDHKRLTMFLDAIGEDGRIFVFKATYGYSRRSVYGESRDGSIRAILMPVYVEDSVNRELDEKGIYLSSPGEQERKYLLGVIYIANLPYRSEATTRLYRTPEKKERVPQVKVIRPRRSYARMDQNTACVKLFPAEELKPMEGKATMFRLRAEMAKNFRDRDEIYKFENGYYVYLGTIPASLSEHDREMLDQAESLSLEELVKALNWTVGPVLETYFARVGKTA